MDPVDDIDIYIIDLYIEEAKKLGLNIEYVFDTHLHADHISGGRKLAEQTEAKYILHSSVDVPYNFSPVEDGDEIMAGNTKIKILHTPGHTPEHISLLVSATP